MADKQEWDECVERAVKLATRETATAWDWADLALEVAKSPGERGHDNKAKAALTKLRKDANTASAVFDEETIPAVKTLLDYRAAAAVVPPGKLRIGLSVRAARALATAEPAEAMTVLNSLNGERRTRELIEQRLAELRESQKRPTFNRVNDNIGWAAWSWNPVTGCKHNCAYCYARVIANRFYEEGFVPTFHEDRLTAPQHTTVPVAAQLDPTERRVFTCSMADLFGKWVNQKWIDAVFEQIVAAPQWEFLTLTKFPQRLAELEWPDNVWAGTTVDKQHRVDVAQRSFAEVKAGVKWLSCEPLLEPLKFESLEMFDWVVIGGCTEQGATEGYPAHPAVAPEWDWVADLYAQARDAGCKVFLKHNLFGSPDGVGPGMAAVHEWPR
jgi:protein gp37